jgi:nicotinamidase-related amidase
MAMATRACSLRYIAGGVAIIAWKKEMSMERRDMLTACGAGAVGLAALGVSEAVGQQTRSTAQGASAGQARLSVDDAAVLLIDHQVGLLSLVGDYSPDEFKNNVLALADTAKSFKLPTILTTSSETGPNGVIMPELKALFPDAPCIPRPGQINAWDNEEFVTAVKKTGRKQLLMAGVVTDVCVAFPALSAMQEGFQVFVVTDASGTFNKQVADAALMRMAHAGAVMTNWFAVACELQRDWRKNGEGLATLLGNHLPAYKNLMTTYSANTKK